ncbi:hypothetical protein GCM10018987_00790 [Streptomyces cremeus]
MSDGAASFSGGPASPGAAGPWGGPAAACSPGVAPTVTWRITGLLREGKCGTGGAGTDGVRAGAGGAARGTPDRPAGFRGGVRDRAEGVRAGRLVELRA